MSLQQNIVDVLYFDYSLSKIVEAYKETIYKRLRASTEAISSTVNLKDLQFYKNVSSLIKNSLNVEYDDEIYKKIMYIRILQILDKAKVYNKHVTDEINNYIKLIEKKTNLSCSIYFCGDRIEDILDWLDTIYDTFNVPYLYTEGIKLIN